jgi:predicted transcriptional regulator
VSKTQVLACIKWLGETQVIACIPLSGSVSIQELADLADVPELILSRTVRMIATAGFLQEPEPGFVAHTALSASFSTELSYFDAAMYVFRV